MDICSQAWLNQHYVLLYTHWVTSTFCTTLKGSTGVRTAGFGRGPGPITLDNVGCVGTEARLIDCPANTIGTHNCDHSEDAGVICTPVIIPGPGKFSYS